MEKNTAMRSSFGRISIELDKYIFIGGEPINGTVHLYVTSPLPPSTLYFRFRGKEKTHWEESLSSHPGAAIVLYDGHASICNTNYEMMKWPDTIPVGYYTLPFNFQTPIGVPGSFKYFEEKTKGEISYHIYTKIENLQTSIEDKTIIYIIQSPVTTIPTINIGKTLALKQCCCNKGRIGMKILWVQDSYKPNDKIEGFLEIDNSLGMQKICGVITRVYYNLRLKDKHRLVKFVSKTLGTKVFAIEVNPGDKLVDESALKISMDMSGFDKKLVNLHSVKGLLIDCAFKIEAHPTIIGNCLKYSSDCRIESAFVVEPFVHFYPVQRIPNCEWEPNIFPPINMIYDNKKEIQETYGIETISEKPDFSSTCITIMPYQQTDAVDTSFFIGSGRIS